MLGVQRSSITCQILDVVVYRLDQAVGWDACLPVKDEVFSKASKLLKIGRDCSGASFLPPLALLFFLIRFRCGSVLCLRHTGMIAPNPRAEQPLGFDTGRSKHAVYWSSAFRLGLRQQFK
jgi:hypothetical protein